VERNRIGNGGGTLPKSNPIGFPDSEKYKKRCKGEICLLCIGQPLGDREHLGLRRFGDNRGETHLFDNGQDFKTNIQFITWQTNQ
jgi:hypothetical protein